MPAQSRRNLPVESLLRGGAASESARGPGRGRRAGGNQAALALVGLGVELGSELVRGGEEQRGRAHGGEGGAPRGGAPRGGPPATPPPAAPADGPGDGGGPGGVVAESGRLDPGSPGDGRGAHARGGRPEGLPVEVRSGGVPGPGSVTGQVTAPGVDTASPVETAPPELGGVESAGGTPGLGTGVESRLPGVDSPGADGPGTARPGAEGPGAAPSGGGRPGSGGPGAGVEGRGPGAGPRGPGAEGPGGARGPGGRGPGAEGRGPGGRGGGAEDRAPGGRGARGPGGGARGPGGGARSPGGPGAGAGGRGGGGRGGGRGGGGGALGAQGPGGARDQLEGAADQALGAQDAPALGGLRTPAEPETLRQSIDAVQPGRQELVDALLGGWEADRARAEVEAGLDALAGEADQHKSAIADRAEQTKAALLGRAQTEIGNLRAAAAQTAATVRGAFAQARTDVQAAADAALGEIEQGLATDLAAVDTRTAAAAEELDAGLRARAEDILAYGAQKDAEPARIVEAEAQRAEREGRAAAALARQKGAAKAGTFGGAEPGPDQARAVREIADPTAADMEQKAADLAARTRQGGGELTGKHAEYAAKVAESIQNAGPALRGALDQAAAGTRATLEQGAEAARGSVQSALDQVLGALDQREEAAVGRVDAAAAGGETRLQGAADAAAASVDEAAAAGQAEVDAVLGETRGALSGIEAPSPEGAQAVLLGAGEAMAAVVEGSGAALDDVGTQAGDALGQGAADLTGQIEGIGEQAVGEAQAASTRAQEGFQQVVERRTQGARTALDQLGASQADTVAKGLAEVDGAVTKAKGEMDARNAELQASVARGVNEGLTELRAPLNGLDGRMSEAADAVRREFEKPWYKKVLSGLWNAVVGLVKGLVVLVVVALLVAAVAATFGIALTAFGAMMIAGALLLAGGFVMACVARSNQLPEAGFGEIALIAAQDTLGITGVREAWTGQDMVTGQHLDLEQRTERGTLGVVNIVMMAAGVRGGFRTTPWTRPAGYPTGMAGVRALGGDLVSGGRETAGALVDRVLGRRPEAAPAADSPVAPERPAGAETPATPEAPSVERPPGAEGPATGPAERPVPETNPSRPPAREPAAAERPAANERLAETPERPAPERLAEERPGVEQPGVETPAVEAPKVEAAKVETLPVEAAKPKPSKGPQRTGDLDALYQEAAEAQAELGQSTREIANSTNGRPVVPENLKGRARAQEKIDADYGGDASKIVDLARSTIEYENFGDLQRGLEAFKMEFEVVRVKNRFESPTDAGYRDVLLNLRTKNGHVVEVQLHLKQVLEVKNGPGHALYEQVREIEARAASENRPLSAQERAQVEQLNAQSRVLYDQAMNSGMKPAPRGWTAGEAVTWRGESGWAVAEVKPTGEVTIVHEQTGAIRRVPESEIARPAERVGAHDDAGPEVQAPPEQGAQSVDTAYVNRGGNQRLHVDTATDPALVRASERAMGRINQGTNLSERVGNLVDHVANDVRYDMQAQQGMYKPTREMPAGEAKLGEMLEAGAVVCREKAVFTHKLLADMGIESRVVTGNVKVNGPNGPGSYGHAWVELADGTVVDGTWGQVYPGGRGYPVDSIVRRQAFYKPRTATDPVQVQQAMNEAARTLGDPRALDALRRQSGGQAPAAGVDALLRPGQEIVIPERAGGIRGWLGRNARAKITRVERDMVFVERNGQEVMYPRDQVLELNGLGE